MKDQCVSFLTQHGKESIVGPVLAELTHYRVQHVTGFDTDALGSFDREVPRAGSQCDAARRKCRLGMELGKSSVGIASEGAFITDPIVGILPWNVEIIVFIDDAMGLEVVGVAQGAAQDAQQLVSDIDSLTTFAAQAGFPSHQLMLRPHGESDARIVKGLADWDALSDAFQRARELAPNGKVFVENDLRAFCNPTRQKMIRSAAEDLAHRLNSECPQCRAPGFWKTEHISGLRCRLCMVPTKLPIAEVWYCAKCGHREERTCRSDVFADPSHCDRCNP